MTAEKSFRFRLYIEALGGLVLICCRHEACRDGIRRYYSPLVRDTPWRSPDITIYVEWPQSDRYLYRARPARAPLALDGVWVRRHGQEAVAWESLTPPLPPLCEPPFAGRFYGLHGACFSFDNSTAIIVAGSSGSGKTSMAVEACVNHGATLLTDETVILHNRTVIAEPFPRAIGLRSADGATKEVLPADAIVPRIGTVPLPVRRLLFLSSESGGTPVLQGLRPTQTFGLLVQHHLDVGGPIDDGIVSLATMARSLPAELFRYGSASQLRGRLEQLVARLVPELEMASTR